MAAEILNKEGRSCLQGEIPHSVAVPMLRYMKALSIHYRDGSTREPFLSKGHQPFERIFESACKSRVIRRKGAIYFGHKTPRHERYFVDYETSFQHLNPRYVYCRRNPAAVWKSLRNMKWNQYTEVEDFISDWKDSVDHYRRMKAAAPERVYMFDLDRFVADGKGVVAEMFSFLGLDLDSSRAQELGSLPNTNSSLAKVGREPAPVPDSELEAIERQLGAGGELPEPNRALQ